MGIRPERIGARNITKRQGNQSGDKDREWILHLPGAGICATWIHRMQSAAWRTGVFADARYASWNVEARIVYSENSRGR